MKCHVFSERRFRLSALDPYGNYHCRAFHTFEKAWERAKEFLANQGRLVALFDRQKNKKVEFNLERSKEKCIKELERNGYLV